MKAMRIKHTDGSGYSDLNFLMSDEDRHGKIRLYFRRRGFKKVALKQPIGSPEFFAEYRRALAGVVAHVEPKQRVVRTAGEPGTLRWLVEQYFKSDAFTALDARTQSVRRGILDDVCAEPVHPTEDQTPVGAGLVADMPPAVIVTLRDRKKDTPEAANSRLKALRQVFKVGVAEKHTDNNPTVQVAYLRVATEGFHSWTPPEVRQYEERHPVGTKAHLAMILLLLTGARRSDVVNLGPQHVREAEDMPPELRAIWPGRWLHYTQHKNRNKKPVTLTIPILPELEEAIVAYRAAQAAAGNVKASSAVGNLVWLATEFGKPHTANGFGTWFGRRCDEAKLPHCSAHGLRKAGATRAAERGATAHQLMAIFGWRTLKEAERYTRAAEQMRLAGGGMLLLTRDSR